MGKIHGIGTYRWTDGRVYFGDWVNDKQHGKGITYLANGKKQEGTFKNGLKVSN